MDSVERTDDESSRLRVLSKVEELVRRVQELESLAASFSQRTTNLQSELDAAIAEKNIALSQSELLKKELQALSSAKTSKAEAHNKSEALEAELTRALEALDATEQTSSKLRSELEFQTSKVSSLEEELESHASAVEARAKEIDSLRRYILYVTYLHE